MMSSFPAKLATAIVVVYLFAVTSALLPNGDSEGSSLAFDCRGGSRKAFPGKEGSLGCEYQLISGKKKVSFSVLRTVPVRSPPAPALNRRGSMVAPATPPQRLR